MAEPVAGPTMPGPVQLYVMPVEGVTVVLMVTLGLPQVSVCVALAVTTGAVVLVTTARLANVEQPLEVFVNVRV